jgi:hypothetical protein
MSTGRPLILPVVFEDRVAAMISFAVTSNNTVERVKFVNAKPVYFPSMANNARWASDNGSSVAWKTAVIRDKDGSRRAGVISGRGHPSGGGHLRRGRGVRTGVDPDALGMRVTGTQVGGKEYSLALRTFSAGHGGGAAGSFDEFAHASADRCRHAPGGVHVGAAARGGV